MNDEQWLAIKDCDKRYDGIFFYALKSTKTVCRPSCTARTPNPKNVEIFYVLEDALKHGYRPCNRCRPDDMDWKGSKYELAQKAKKYIDGNYADKFSLQVISNNLYINAYYLHRAFKDIMGFTLLQYQHKVRINQSISLLTKTELSVSSIAYDVGYSNLSHFSRIFKKSMGISPKTYRNRYKNNRDKM
ncbi:Bifunctional transcriptional activator/DNA repair enzyme AdaA [Clostridium perfringens]|uniref:bifunctional transcriptional activator/DNA repair enzyme AdaA n=1 Tax=Clostridium perfringens TaxID=1502 RepID=UPI002468FA35|nr:Ada metal-binding domain-containing protein [Clostridium perfringens]MDH5074789.1 Bifunctional transcriptional activator/DNA repair enzyme AdaA [Clostridium perfringens]